MLILDSSLMALIYFSRPILIYELWTLGDFGLIYFTSFTETTSFAKEFAILIHIELTVSFSHDDSQDVLMVLSNEEVLL